MGDGTLDRKITNAVSDEVDSSLGSDIVTNGTFDADTHWDRGTGWCIDSGVASSDASQTTWSALVNNQDGASNTVVSGKTYRAKFSVTRSAGFVQLKTGTTHYNFSATEDVDIVFQATGTSWYFTADQHFVGTLDNVSIQLVGGSSGVMDNMADDDFTGDTP